MNAVRFDVGWLATLLSVTSLMALSCTADEGGSSGTRSDADDVPLPVPELLRGIDPSDLVLSGSIAGTAFELDEPGGDGLWRVTITVPENVPIPVALTWTNGAGIPLATLDTVLPAVSGDDTLRVGADEYVTSGLAFDDDQDGASNVDELRCGSDPSSDSSQPDPTDECLLPSATTDTVVDAPAPSSGGAVISACDTLPITSTVQRPDPANPLAAVAGALYGGTLSEGFLSHYDLPLTVGRHLLVVDAHDVAGVFLSDITVDRLDEAGEVVGTLINDSDLDKTRFLTTLESSAPETLRLRLSEGAFGDDTVYTFGVFSEGESVPSPFFTRCPTVISISDGVDVTFEFERGFENEVFLAFDADEIRQYELEVFATDLDPAPFSGPGIFFQVELVDDYGQLEPGETAFGNQLLRFGVGESPVRRSATFSTRETGVNWIRFRTRLFGLSSRYSVQANLRRNP